MPWIRTLPLAVQLENNSACSNQIVGNQIYDSDIIPNILLKKLMIILEWQHIIRKIAKILMKIMLIMFMTTKS